MQNSRESVAYDLSLFEPRERKVVPIRKKAKETEKKAKRANAAKAVKTFFVFAVLLSLGIVLLFNQARMSEINAETNEEKRLLKEAQEEGIHLQMELEGKMSVKNVEEYATEILGMKKIEASQIERITIDEGDKVVITEKDKAGGVFGFLKGNLSELLSYLS